MVAVMTICLLLALGAALEEIYYAVRRSMECRRSRRAATWRARRVAIRYPHE